MRTSRISRDTAKVLSSTRASSTRQTRAAAALRSFALNSNDAGHVTTGTERDSGNLAVHSDSELSSVPDDVESEGQEGLAASRKRKRGQNGLSSTTVTVNKSEDVLIKTEGMSTTQNGKPKKARRAPAKKSVAANGSVKVEPPPNWEEVYELTRQMREATIAPVDTMGCDTLADRNDTPRNQRFQTLVALMLSSQTKDTVTSVAIKGMQQNMPGGLNLESVLAIEPAALNAFISKVGFHNLKTKYIKQAAEIIRDKWNSDIPDTIAGLTSLPGVGPKMAYLCMSAAWGRDEGIGVDVHVHRITNLWGWHKTKQPEETRAQLESWLPKERWHDINAMLVGFGQTICLPVGRRCGECKLAEKGLCPSAVVGKATRVKKEEVTIKQEHQDDSAILRRSTLKIEQHSIKAEEVDENNIPDIEDIGKATLENTGG